MKLFEVTKPRTYELPTPRPANMGVAGHFYTPYRTSSFHWRDAEFKVEPFHDHSHETILDFRFNTSKVPFRGEPAYIFSEDGVYGLDRPYSFCVPPEGNYFTIRADLFSEIQAQEVIEKPTPEVSSKKPYDYDLDALFPEYQNDHYPLLEIPTIRPGDDGVAESPHHEPGSEEARCCFQERILVLTAEILFIEKTKTKNGATELPRIIMVLLFLCKHTLKPYFVEITLALLGNNSFDPDEHPWAECLVSNHRDYNVSPFNPFIQCSDCRTAYPNPLRELRRDVKLSQPQLRRLHKTIFESLQTLNTRLHVFTDIVRFHLNLRKGEPRESITLKNIIKIDLNDLFSMVRLPSTYFYDEVFNLIGRLDTTIESIKRLVSQTLSTPTLLSERDRQKDIRFFRRKVQPLVVPPSHLHVRRRRRRFI